MRLFILYAAQVAFIVAGFAAISSVFVSINSDAMSSTVTNLLSSTAHVATSQALAPLDKFAVQATVWADIMNGNPRLRCNNVSSVEWTVEDIHAALNPSYVPPLQFRLTEGKELKLSIQRNNPLVLYVYETFEMPPPANTSQWMDCGSGRNGHDFSSVNNYHFYSPSLHQSGVTPSYDQIDCFFNLSDDGYGRLTQQVVDPSYYCVNTIDLYPSPQGYQVAARALTHNDSRTGKWIASYASFDPSTNFTSQLLTFSVPLTFSTPDPVTGEYHCTSAVCFDLNGQYLTDALQAEVIDGVQLALFWDAEESLVSWTLDAPSSDPSTGALLYAGSTGSQFDDAVAAFHSAGWCPGVGEISNCVSPSDGSSVSTSSYVFVLRRVVHINARFTVVISGKRATFFGPGERARAVGIGVSIAVCVVCLATSLALWLTTVRPLRRLISNMELASTFSSQVDAEGDSCITEVNEANVAFLSMHEQLLSAKPFMPQHLLEQFDEARHVKGDNETSDMESSVPTHTDDARTVVSSIRTKTVRSSRASPASYDRDGVVPLESRFVSVLIVNISSFDKLIRGLSTAEIQANYAKFIDAVLTAARAHRGVLDSAQGDHVMISFNTTLRCASPAAKAVQTAFAIRCGLDGLSEPWRRVTFGISVGHAHCGTLGSTNAKSHATLGTVVRQAIGLQRVARALDDQRDTADTGSKTAPRWCVATARVVQDCTTFAHFRYEAIVSLPPSGRTTVIATVFPPADIADAATNPNHPSVIASDVAGEWLYQVNATVQNNPHAEHNVRVHSTHPDLNVVAQNVMSTTPLDTRSAELYSAVAQLVTPQIRML